MNLKNHLRIKQREEEGELEDEGEEGEKKLDEVDKLMAAADEAEAHEKYLHSDEYKKLQD